MEGEACGEEGLQAVLLLLSAEELPLDEDLPLLSLRFELEDELAHGRCPRDRDCSDLSSVILTATGSVTFRGVAASSTMFILPLSQVMPLCFAASPALTH